MDQVSTADDTSPAVGDRPERPVADRTAEKRPAAGDPGPARPRSSADRWGWFGIAAITALVAASWAPQFTFPLGDNHPGRIFARHALHLRNFQEKGLVDSGFTADWSPYVNVVYAHHPPLLNIFDVLFGYLPGSGTHEILIGPYLVGLLVVPASAALLRAFQVGWVSTLLAVGVMVATGFFWLYSPLMFDMGLILALSAAIVQLRNRPDPSRGLVIATCVLALLTTLSSWPGVSLAAVLGLWLFAARRFDRATVAVGASMVVGVAISLAFVVGVSGMEIISSQTQYRTSGGGFTVAEFFGRQLRFARDGLPFWYFILLPLGLVAGLLHRRTRFYLVVSAAFAAGWVLLLNNGSFIHSYWAYPMLIPGVVGMGVLFDWLAARMPRRAFAVGAIAAGLVLTMTFASLVFGATGQRSVYGPVKAGRLVADTPPAPGQQYAWAPGISAPRWIAYYWDLPTRSPNQQMLAEEANPDDLVLVRLNRLPAWVPESAVDAPVAQEGNYALVRVSDILGG